MRRRRSFGGLAIVAVTLTGACGTPSAEGAAVDYEAEDLVTGTVVDVADLRGQVVLLSGWATWCAPCREELPDLNELYEARRDDGLTVVAVNLDAAGPSTRGVLPLVEKMGLTMPTWIDSDNDFALAYGAVSMPTNVLIDRAGVVRHTWNGAIDPDDDDVARLIDDVLDEAA